MSAMSTGAATATTQSSVTAPLRQEATPGKSQGSRFLSSGRTASLNLAGTTASVSGAPNTYLDLSRPCNNVLLNDTASNKLNGLCSTDSRWTNGVPGFWSVNTSNPDGSTNANWDGVQLGGCYNAATGCRAFSDIYDNGTMAVHQLWHSGGVDAFKIVAAGEPALKMGGPPVDSATGRPLSNPNDELTHLRAWPDLASCDSGECRCMCARKCPASSACACCAAQESVSASAYCVRTAGSQGVGRMTRHPGTRHYVPLE